jgi:hypothetical protein
MASKEELNRIIEYRDVLGEITKELGKKTNHIKEAVKSYTNLDSIAKQLQINEEITNTLSDKQLDKLKSKAALQIQELKRSAELLAKSKGIEDINGAILGFKRNLNEEEEALLRAYQQGFKLEQESLDIINKEVETREKVNKSLGFAGNSMKFLNSIAGGLGKALNIDQISKDMEDFANESIRAGKEVGRLQTLGVGLKSAFKGFAQTVTDPTIIFTKVLGSFFEIEKQQVNFQRQTGQSISQFSDLGSSAVTAAEQMAVMGEITQQMGMDARILGKENIAEAAEMVNLMGMSAQEAGNLAKFATAGGHDLKNMNESTVKIVNDFNKSNKTAISQKQIISDMANVSGQLAASFAKNPGALAAAAAEARKLGLSLNEMEGIADNLLNFESSIASEIEAELLTGKQLNLEKARTAALNNDMKTLSAEIGKNEEITSAFASGNRIQQKAIAEAMGMSVEQMSKMHMQHLINNGQAEKAKQLHGETALEDLKAAEAKEKISRAITKITEKLAPLIEILADVVSNSAVIYTVLGAVALTRVPSLMKGFQSMASSVGGIKDGITGMFKGMKDGEGIMGKMKSGLGGIMGDKGKGAIPGVSGDDGGVNKAKSSLEGVKSIGENIKDIFGNIIDLIGRVGENIGKLGKGIGTAISGILRGLGQGLMALAPGLAALANPLTLLGLAAFTGAMIGLGFALNLAAPGIAAFGVVIDSVFKGIATVITAVADGFVKFLDAITLEKVGVIMSLGAALFSVAAGLGAVAIAGIAALPAIAGLTILTTIGGALDSLFGGDGEKSESKKEDKEDPTLMKLDELNTNIMKLISIVEKGGNVTMDGAAVGKVLALGSSKLG